MTNLGSKEISRLAELSSGYRQKLRNLLYVPLVILHLCYVMIGKGIVKSFKNSSWFVSFFSLFIPYQF
jgi:hypothetical protein